MSNKTESSENPGRELADCVGRLEERQRGWDLPRTNYTNSDGIVRCSYYPARWCDGSSELRCRCFLHDFHVAVHRLCQLRIHFIRDSHNIG